MRYRWTSISQMLIIIVLLCGYTSAMPSSMLESFDSKWQQRWSVHKNNDATMEVLNNKLFIKSPTHSYALIAKKNNNQTLRLSAKIKAGDAITWTTSLFLYWDDRNWLQFGVIEDKTFLITQMVDGYPVEKRKLIIDPNAWHYLAIELGNDVARVYFSIDNKKWTLLRSYPRVKSWLKAPSYLVIGKGYSAGKQPYGASLLQNSYHEKGEVRESVVSQVSITPIPKSKLKATADEKRVWKGDIQDEVGNAILAQKGDPTYDKVIGLYPPMKRPREAIGVKDHPLDFIIEPDGAILFSQDNSDGNAPRVRFAFGADSVLMGSPRLPIKKSVVPNLPVIVQTAKQDSVELKLTTHAWSSGMSPDTDPWVYMSLVCRNTSKQNITLPISVQVSAVNTLVSQIQDRVTLKAGQSKTLTFRAPYKVQEQGIESIAGKEYDASWREMCAAWNPSHATSFRFQIPEARVQRMLEMSLIYGFINTDKLEGILKTHDGTGFYEMIYGYSAVLFCNALDLYGYHKQSEAYIESLMTLIQPDGLFEINYGASDMGSFLYSMSQHYQFTRDKEWLIRVAPKMKLMANWLLNKRKLSMQYVNGKRPVTYGLIKYRPYCDYIPPTYTYLTDTYSVVGIEKMATVFQEVGLQKDAKYYAEEAKKYRHDVLVSMKNATITKYGQKMLPLEPDTHRLLKDNGYTGADYYGLVSPIILENGFLTADSPYANMIVSQLEGRNGLFMRMAKFNDGIDHAYTYGYWLNLLNQDQVRPVILALYGSIAYGMTPGTYGGVECTQILTGENDRTTPHTYSATQQLRLVRMMLLREQGDALWIGQAMPRSWLSGKSPVVLENVPTLFGPVSFRYEPNIEKKVIKVTLKTPQQSKIRSILLRIRCPEGRTIREVTYKGTKLPIKNETVQIKPDLREMAVIVKLR